MKINAKCDMCNVISMAFCLRGVDICFDLGVVSFTLLLKQIAFPIFEAYRIHVTPTMIHKANR